MTYNKGDLVLISDEKRVYTCILLTDLYLTGAGTKFYFSHCVETGSNGMIYENEPAVILAKSHVNNEWFVHTISGKQIWHVGVNLKLIAKGKN